MIGSPKTGKDFPSIIDSYIKASCTLANVKEKENYDLSRELLIKCQETQPKDPRIYNNMLVLDSTWNDEANLAESKKALATLVQAHELEDPIISFNFGIQAYSDVVCGLRQKNYEDAKRLLKPLYHGSTMDNFSLMAGLNLAAISEETGDRQQALEYYEQV